MTTDSPAIPGAPVSTRRRAPPRPSRATMLVYFGALIAMFMASLDMQIVVTALPTIAGELGNLHLFGWVGRRLPAVHRRGFAVLRQARRHVRAQERRDHRHRAVPHRLAGLRHRLVDGEPDRRARAAGHRRRRADGLGLCHDRRTVRSRASAPNTRAIPRRSSPSPRSSARLPAATSPICFGWRWVFFVNLPSASSCWSSSPSR